MAHTPGPWLAKKGAGWIVHRPDAEARKEAAIMVGMSPAVSLVCDPAAKWFEDGEAEANAHLISAAPELLELVKEFNILFDGDGFRNDLAENLPRLLEKADATISKAEGRQ